MITLSVLVLVLAPLIQAQYEYGDLSPSELELASISERLQDNLPEYLSLLTSGELEIPYWTNEDAARLQEKLDETALDVQNAACASCRVRQRVKYRH